MLDRVLERQVATGDEFGDADVNLPGNKIFKPEVLKA